MARGQVGEMEGMVRLLGGMMKDKVSHSRQC